MDITVFLTDRLDFGQLIGLAIVVDLYLTGEALASVLIVGARMLLDVEIVGVPSLSQSSIIERTAGIKRLLQAFTLLARWIQSEFVGLLRHAFGSRCIA